MTCLDKWLLFLRSGCCYCHSVKALRATEGSNCRQGKSHNVLITGRLRGVMLLHLHAFSNASTISNWMPHCGASCSHLCASVTKQYNVVPAKGQWCSAAGKVTAGLVESNGSLPPAGLTACTPGSSPGPTLGNEHGKPLPFLTLIQLKQEYLINSFSCWAVICRYYFAWFTFERALLCTRSHVTD